MTICIDLDLLGFSLGGITVHVYLPGESDTTPADPTPAKRTLKERFQRAYAIHQVAK